MTIEDIIDFLCDENAEQTLTAMHIRRSVLLAYEMGMVAGVQEASGRQIAIVQAIYTRERASQEEPPRLPTCRWCGQPLAAHPQEGEPWRCRLTDGPLLPTEDTDHA